MVNFCIVCGKCISKTPVYKDVCSLECNLSKLNRQKNSVRYCVNCGKTIPGKRRRCCSDKCGKLARSEKPKINNFAEYEKAAAEAKKQGEYLSYGKYMAGKYMAERSK